jgi:hypothetical protein
MADIVISENRFLRLALPEHCRASAVKARFSGMVVVDDGCLICATTVPFGLGDMVAAGLSAIGITKERVSAVVGGDCGCGARQQKLNELGRKIGIG